ncbi:hypothetical protein ACFL2D_01745 [Patescibacteria group bacterium]
MDKSLKIDKKKSYKRILTPFALVATTALCSFTLGYQFDSRKPIARFDTIPERVSANITVRDGGFRINNAEEFVVSSESSVKYKDNEVLVADYEKPVYVFTKDFECVINVEALPEPQAKSEDCSSAPEPVQVSKGEVLASKNGEKYYYKDCSTLSRILPENLVSFESAAEAEEEGYEPSSCVLDDQAEE